MARLDPKKLPELRQCAPSGLKSPRSRRCACDENRACKLNGAHRRSAAKMTAPGERAKSSRARKPTSDMLACASWSESNWITIASGARATADSKKPRSA
eukprot:1486211-Prymnesium_polylepis.1